MIPVPDRFLAEEIAKKARESLSTYCINTCKAQCCRKGKLLLQNEKELETIAGTKKEKEFKEKILEKTPFGNYTYNLEKQSCPHLKKDWTCAIHKEERRPQICSDYPLFLVKNKFILANSCPGVRENLLTEYSKELKEKAHFKEL